MYQMFGQNVPLFHSTPAKISFIALPILMIIMLSCSVTDVHFETGVNGCY